jgi:aldehyde dehydrogenase (NAD+)
MEIPALVKAQREFFASGKTRDVAYRLQALKKLRDVLIQREDQIAEALRKDFGKPFFESFTTEIGYVLSDINHTIKGLNSWAKPRRVKTPLVLQPGKSEIHYEPFGCSLIIAPWNYPFQLQISPLIGAIAAGNTAIVKPSEVTKHTQKFICDVLQDNFPPEYIAGVGGGVTESQQLLEEKFDLIFFTGSTRVGRIVMEKAAKHLTPVVLELGGKSPCIVDKDIDLKTAARRIVWGKFMNASQTCVAPDYICIHSDIYEEFLKQLKATIVEFYGENPKQSESYARLVNEMHFDRVVGLIDKNKLYHGGESDRSTLYIAPTVLRDVSWNDRVMEDEIFGPVMPCFKYDNVDELIRTINSKPKPLSFYLFTRNKNLQEKVLAEVPFGGASVNDCLVHLANPELPFGGVGESGMGAYHGKQSFEVFSHKKSVLRKPFALDATMRYPPYTAFNLKLIRFFMK